jgi:hypothetical protein
MVLKRIFFTFGAKLSMKIEIVVFTNFSSHKFYAFVHLGHRDVCRLQTDFKICIAVITVERKWITAATIVVSFIWVDIVNKSHL